MNTSKPIRYVDKPSRSKFVMTFAEYCDYQRRLENTGKRSRINLYTELLRYAEIINPWQPTNLR